MRIILLFLFLIFVMGCSRPQVSTLSLEQINKTIFESGLSFVRTNYEEMGISLNVPINWQLQRSNTNAIYLRYTYDDGRKLVFGVRNYPDSSLLDMRIAGKGSHKSARLVKITKYGDLTVESYAKENSKKTHHKRVKDFFCKTVLEGRTFLFILRSENANDIASPELLVKLVSGACILHGLSGAEYQEKCKDKL